MNANIYKDLTESEKKEKIRQNALERGRRYRKTHAVLISERKAEHRKKNPDYQKDYYRKNKSKIDSRQRKYYITNRVKYLAYFQRYSKTIPIEKLRKQKREYARRNPEKLKLWSLKNPERRREISRNWQRRNMETIQGRLAHRMSVGICMSLRGKKGAVTWLKMVGYTLNDLKRHIENQFTIGMDWEKLMANEIHIDHIIPKSKFNYSSPEDIQFKQCWALENLRPLWAKDNLSKHASIIPHSQIALGV